MQTNITYFNRQLLKCAPEPAAVNQLHVPCIATAGVILVAFVDLITGYEVSLSILYLLPIGLGVWLGGLPVGVMISLIAAAAWFAIDRIGTPYSHPFTPYWNGLVRMGFFFITAILLNRVRLLTSDLALLVRSRTEDLDMAVGQRKEVEREVAETSRREQERLACELHDQMGGYLAGVAFRAMAAAERHEQKSPAAAAELRDVVGMINHATAQVREFSRMLDPIYSEGGNLGSVLTQFGNQFSKAFSITCHVDCDADLPPLPQGDILQLRRIVQEACRNAVNHGKSRTVWISSHIRGENIEVAVRSETPVPPLKNLQPAGMGLHIMQYRAGLLGGVVEYAPATCGRPYTTVTCRIPACSEGSRAPHPLPFP